MTGVTRNVDRPLEYNGGISVDETVPKSFMRWKSLFALAILFAVASTGSAKVRVQVVNGRKVIFNDGVGEKSAGRHGAGTEWLAARISRPSAFDPLITRAANDHSLDPRLVKSVMLVESGFNPAAVSRKGARGLMQLMPGTASRHGARDVHDPAQNIAAGTRYLSHLLGLFNGNLEKSLAAYNGRRLREAGGRVFRQQARPRGARLAEPTSVYDGPPGSPRPPPARLRAREREARYRALAANDVNRFSAPARIDATFSSSRCSQ